MPLPQPGQPPQQAPASAMPDPMAMLMEEYERLKPPETPAAPRYSPEEQNRRIDQNNKSMQLGLLGQMANDKGISHVGGQIFKQALGDRNPRKTSRGEVDNLTGVETIDPGWQEQQNDSRRNQVLGRISTLQQARDAAAQRADEANRQREFRAQQADEARIFRKALADQQADLRRELAAARAAGEGKPPNMVQITDPNTGATNWFNPKTGQDMGPVTFGSGGAAQNGPTPLVKPSKMASGDDKEMTGITSTRATIAAAKKAVEATPGAFGFRQGMPNQMGDGVIGNIARATQNRLQSPAEIQARGMVYNVLSAAIKERAGTAQSAQELKRLNAFLPGDMDDARTIMAKLDGFQQYLNERETGLRSKYNANRPVEHGGSNMGQQPAPQQPAADGWSIELVK